MTSPTLSGRTVEMTLDELAERVALAAQRFCSELCEDADGVPQPELRSLHDALDAWEGAQDENA